MTPKKRIGEMLMEAGIIDEAQLKAALGHQRQWGVRLGQALVELKLASEADVVAALSVKFGFPVAELGSLEPHGLEQALKLLPREFAVRNNVLPMAADTASVTVAMSDPTNLAVVDEIRFRTGRKVKVCIAGDREVAQELHRHYPGEHGVEAIALDLDADDVEGEAVFDPFGGGSKDALEAFFSPSEAHAAVDTIAAAPAAPQAPAPAPATPAPSPAPHPRVAAPQLTRPPAPAAVRPPAPAPAASAPAAPAPRAATASTPARAAPAAAPSAAPQPAAGPARPPAPAPAPAAARPAAPPPPASAPRRELELEELTPGPGGPVRAPPAEATGTAEFTLTDEVTGSGLLVPEGGAPPAAGTLTEREVEVLRALERLAGGAHAEPEILKPAQAMAALALLLVKKGIVTEQELLAAIARR